MNPEQEVPPYSSLCGPSARCCCWMTATVTRWERETEIRMTIINMLRVSCGCTSRLHYSPSSERAGECQQITPRFRNQSICIEFGHGYVCLIYYVGSCFVCIFFCRFLCLMPRASSLQNGIECSWMRETNIDWLFQGPSCAVLIINLIFLLRIMWVSLSI